MEKKILNANPNVNNIANIHKEGKRDIIDALETIEGILEPIYGKNALYNMIPILDGSAMKGVNIFTSDGINCIKQCDFESPIQNYFRDIIQYIGEHTERKAGDGTTTNMLLVTKLLLTFVFYDLDNNLSIDEDDPRNLLGVKGNNNEISDYVNEFINFINIVEDEFNNNIHPVKEHSDNIRRLINTTSKSNPDIQPIIKLLDKIPADAYEYIRRENSLVETDTIIDINYKDCDYSCYIHDFPHTLYNNTTQSHFESDKVDVLVIDEEIIDPALFDSIYQHIIEHLGKNPDRYLVTLCSSTDQEKLMSIKMNLNTTNPAHKFIPLTYTNPNTFLSKRYLELNILNLITSTKSIKEHGLTKDNQLEDYLISPTKFQCDGMEMKLFGCISTKENCSLDLDKIDNIDRYNFLLKEITDELDYNNNHRKRAELGPNITGLKYMKELLLTPTLPTILLGGKTHDVTSNMDMIDDIVQVVYNAKKHGVVHNGNVKLLISIDDSKESNRYTDSMEMFRKEFRQILKEMIELTEMESYDSPVQCSIQYTELFKLIREMIPRIMKTDNIIATNAVMLNKKEEKDNDDT